MSRGGERVSTVDFASMYFEYLVSGVTSSGPTNGREYLGYSLTVQ